MQPSSINPVFFLGLSRIYALLAQALADKAGLGIKADWARIREIIGEIDSELVEGLWRAGRGDIVELKESICRRGLDKKSRSIWHKVLERVYDEYGFEVDDKGLGADHVIVQFLFISQLFEDAFTSITKNDGEKLIKAILAINRFINSHTIPTLTECQTSLSSKLVRILNHTKGYIQPIAIQLVKNISSRRQN